jgi:hypothetical protein
MLVCDMDTWQHPVARQLAEGAFTRAIANGRSALAHDIAKKLRPVEVFTPSGVFTSIAYGAEMPLGRVRRVLATMVRGLYAYYTGDRLPENAEFTVHRVRDLPRVMPIVRAVSRWEPCAMPRSATARYSTASMALSRVILR